MRSLIQNVKAEAISKSWINGQIAQFYYNEREVSYHLIEYTSDIHYIKSGIEGNEKDCPIVSLGFVAYLIHNWGKSETEIYLRYYELCLSGFKKVEEKLPGSFMRDLEAEYYNHHIEEENARVAASQKIYPYLTDNDSKLISQYVKSYFEFIKITYGKQSLIKRPSKKTEPKLFSAYLLHDERELLAEKLKTEFSTETGKGIRLMIESLQANEPKLLSVENRQRKAIHTALEIFFDRNIGTRQSIFDYQFDRIADEIDFNAIRLKLNFILISINKAK